MRIDFHVHAYGRSMTPMAFFRHRADQLILQRPTSRTREELAERIHVNATDEGADILVGDLDAAGIDHAGLVGTDWAALSEDPEPETHPRHHLREFGKVVARHPGRFSVILGVDPRRPDAAEIARDALAEPWVRGIKLYPPMGFSAADPVCAPVYDALVEAGKFAMFHTGRASYPFDLEGGRLEQYSRVQRSHPELSIVLAHAGYHMWGQEALEVAVGHPSTYVELSNWNHADRETGRAFIRQAIERVGIGRVLFATDHFAGPHAKGAGEKIRSWREAYEEVAAELGHDVERLDDPARRLLGLDEPR